MHRSADAEFDALDGEFVDDVFRIPARAGFQGVSSAGEILLVRGHP